MRVRVCVCVCVCMCVYPYNRTTAHSASSSMRSAHLLLEAFHRHQHLGITDSSVGENGHELETPDRGQGIDKSTRADIGDAYGNGRQMKPSESMHERILRSK